MQHNDSYTENIYTFVNNINIPREYFMKYMGDGSKILGILLSFIYR